MRIGSLFAGIGGLELGLERAGVGHTVWQVERDPYCQRVLAKHWPDAIRYDDVTAVDWDAVEPVEVLCGGFPCQDISLAGRGGGLAGERSGLWRHYADAVRRLRPRYVVVENVAALLARGLGDVLADLAACRYDCEWDCLPAAAVGAPHRRDRLFVLAYPGGARRRQDPRSALGDESQDEGRAAQHDHVADGDGEGRQPGHVADARVVGRDGRARVEGAGRNAAIGGQTGDNAGDGSSTRPDVADTEGQPVRPGLCDSEPGGQRRGRPGDVGCAGYPWAVEPDVGRVAHGVPARVDRLRTLGNAVVPQVAEVVGRRIMQHEAAVTP